jgi:hypothetical protein
MVGRGSPPDVDQRYHICNRIADRAHETCLMFISRSVSLINQYIVSILSRGSGREDLRSYHDPSHEFLQGGVRRPAAVPLPPLAAGERDRQPEMNIGQGGTGRLPAVPLPPLAAGERDRQQGA